MDTVRLTPAQLAAIDHVRRGAAPPPVAVPHAAGLVAAVAAHGRITLNFHPDRVLPSGRTVAESMAACGKYRGQYETGLSSGSRTAFAGGLRDSWELALFGGAYHGPGVLPGDRPKYGALNLMRHADGAAPRFGSCHVRLRPEVSHRATFCYGDSHLGPEFTGTLAAFEGVLGGLVAGAAASGYTLGVSGVDPVAHLLDLAAQPARPNGRALDDYVEAQVHGEIDLVRDAEALVLDPSFRGTAAGEQLASIGVPVEWHAGFVLAADEVGADFRGPVMPRLAAWICAEGEELTASVLGRAAAGLHRDSQNWARWGTEDECLQYVKQLWHVLVWSGRAAGEPVAE
ncbi:DUF3626 domain-containing protein [Longispora albida]|uniref:DUF3626 domain-containing protein n=1 Tax=Longispora albida TaxID=203523 RepID=UPI0003735BE2|nr:DUF3626 domain-containing protein [Longispora albida]